MAVFLILSAILGLAVSFGTPKEYKASVMLAPETSSSNSLTSNISSLASMVGMDMDFGSSNDAIYPEIYPDLLQSSDFIVGLFGVEVVNKDGSVRTDYYDYFRYPDGRTVANRNGRKRHTDARGSYSDCHEDRHQDHTSHTDKANPEKIERFRPWSDD